MLVTVVGSRRLASATLVLAVGVPSLAVGQTGVMRTVGGSRSEPMIAAAPGDGRAVPSLPPIEESRSLGRSNRGHLLGGIELQDSPELEVKLGSEDARWGTAELVHLVEGVAHQIITQFADARLTVGDLSRPSGGRHRPHRSHQNGLDVDIGFYLRDADGVPVHLNRFVNLGRRGCGESLGETFCLDAARTWALLESLIRHAGVRIQYVMVAPYLRRLILEAGRRAGARPDSLVRAREVTAPHGGSRSHRSHFHVRIYCPSDDRPDCIDQPPFHPWFEGEPPEIDWEEIRRLDRRATRRFRAQRRIRARRRALRRRELRRQRRAALRARRQRLGRRGLARQRPSRQPDGVDAL